MFNVQVCSGFHHIFEEYMQVNIDSSSIFKQQKVWNRLEVAIGLETWSISIPEEGSRNIK